MIWFFLGAVSCAPKAGIDTRGAAVYGTPPWLLSKIVVNEHYKCPK